jgi:glycosyltransferase involved in cell wall biosynthesis
MERRDLVSVIIPAYNAEKYLAETIQSVLDQTYSAIEVIIVNDGSTDQTAMVLEQFSSNPKIRYLSQQNMGCSGAKNAGLQMAQGKFIQFLDADDLLSPDKIEKQVELLGNDENGIAVCKTRVFSDSGNKDGDSEIDTEFLYTTNNTLEFILNLYGLNGKNGMIQPNAFLVPKKIAEAVGPYNLSISPAPDEDGEYFCRVMLAAGKIYYAKEGTNYYRRPVNANASLSRQVSHHHAQGGLRSLILIAKHVLAAEDSNRVRQIMASHFAGYIYQYSNYSDLVRMAEAEIEKLGVKKIPSAGSEHFRTMTKWVGFHNALRLKNLLNPRKG